eukprot:366566-Chlamydomonas_euryale.AAC.1
MHSHWKFSFRRCVLASAPVPYPPIASPQHIHHRSFCVAAAPLCARCGRHVRILAPPDARPVW